MAENRHTYDYQINIDSNTGPARAIHMVGSKKRVLEVGAGPGSITRVLKERFDCEVTALEFDTAAIEQLKPYCQKVFRADLNDPAWPLLLQHEPDYDVVVCTDVLEHLQEPLKTLSAMKSFLRQDTYMVISLPNIGHMSISACLYNCDFKYSNFGLLDKTHIRFFSLKNIQTLFADAGLKIIEVEFVTARPEDTEFSEQWAALPDELKKALAKSRHGFVYQVVFKAARNDHPGESVDIFSTSVPPPPRPGLITLAKRFLKRRLGARGISRIKKILAILGNSSRTHQ